MNQIATQITMSSREIAELTGKTHHHVKRDIKTMLNAVEIGVSRFGCTYLDQQNKTQDEFRLPKKLTLLLVSGYDVVLRLKIIDRLEELETQNGYRLPQTLAEALRLAADLAEQSDSQNTEIKRMAPKERAHDLLRRREGSVSIAEASMMLGATFTGLMDFMRRERWVYHKGRSLHAYQHQIRQGTMEEVLDPDFAQVRITPMGLQRLSRRFSKGMALCL